MVAPQAYNYWLQNQFMIPDLPPITPVVYNPPVVPQVQPPQYAEQPWRYDNVRNDSGGSSPAGPVDPIGFGGLSDSVANAFGVGPSEQAAYTSPSRLGGAGMLLSGATIVPGLGLLGAGLGSINAANVGNRQAARSFGVQKDISALNAFADAMFFGLPNSSVADQLSSLGAEASSQPDGTFGSVADDYENPYGPISAEDWAGFDAAAAQSSDTVGHNTEGGRADRTNKDTMGPGADSGDDSTVICTELFRQGRVHGDWKAGDAAYGRWIWRHDPYVMVGYHAWAKPLVRVMKKSSTLSSVVGFIVRPAIKELAARGGGDILGSLIGKIIVEVGIPICRIVGKYVAKGNARAAKRGLGKSV